MLNIFFTCLLVIWISSLMSNCLGLLPIFKKIELFFFLLLILRVFFYILDTCPLSDTSFEKVSLSLRLVFPFYWHWFLQNRLFWLQWTLKSESESHSVVSNSLWPHGLYSPQKSPSQNTGVDSCSLLQGIFPTQGWNPALPHCRWILYQLSHQGSPRILEWVAIPFSSGSSQPRNRTGVSCIAGRFFTSWRSLVY